MIYPADQIIKIPHHCSVCGAPYGQKFESLYKIREVINNAGRHLFLWKQDYPEPDAQQGLAMADALGRTWAATTLGRLLCPDHLSAEHLK